MCDNNSKRAQRHGTSIRLDKHRDTIEQMISEGMRRQDMADELGVHLNTLKRYISSQGLGRGNNTVLTDDKKSWLKEHYGTMGMSELADTIGIHRSTVYNYLTYHGIHKPERRDGVRIRRDLLSGRWS